MSRYSARKTVKKAALPVSLAALLELLILLAKTKGIDLDAATVLAIAGAGYGAVVALINWLKNRRRASTPLSDRKKEDSK